MTLDMDTELQRIIKEWVMKKRGIIYLWFDVIERNGYLDRLNASYKQITEQKKWSYKLKNKGWGRL